jgi:hypothetical protein
VFARSRCRAGAAALASLALAVGVLGAVVLSVWSVPAAFAATTTTAKCPTPEILGGIKATGATITTPGAKKRTLDQDQATAFMQTWLAFSVFENPPQQRPPAGVPISQLDVATIQSDGPSAFLIFYADDGTQVWVGAPAAIKAPPPNDQKWIRAPKPEQTRAAFAGDMGPICTDPVSAPSSAAPASTTTVAQAVKPNEKSSDDGTPWAAIIIGLVVVVGGGALALRSRRRPASLSSR